MLQPSIECRSIPPHMAGSTQVELAYSPLGLMPSHAWNNPTDVGIRTSQTVSLAMPRVPLCWLVLEQVCYIKQALSSGMA